MKIDLLYIAECPSWFTCLKNIKHALIELDDESQVTTILLNSLVGDGSTKFQGSPTILVDGRDIFPVDDYDGALSCRVYSTPDGLRGMPSASQIFERLKSIKDSRQVADVDGVDDDN